MLIDSKIPKTPSVTIRNHFSKHICFQGSLLCHSFLPSNPICYTHCFGLYTRAWWTDWNQVLWSSVAQWVSTPSFCSNSPRKGFVLFCRLGQNTTRYGQDSSARDPLASHHVILTFWLHEKTFCCWAKWICSACRSRRNWFNSTGLWNSPFWLVFVFFLLPFTRSLLKISDKNKHHHWENLV